jgi:alpha-beta hydrolase superfamily lysophospholipase
MRKSVSPRHELSPPPLRLLARESMYFAYMRVAARFGKAAPLPQANGAPVVMIIPGFMANDATTARLRRSLNAAGYSAHGWGLGRNSRVAPDLFGKLQAQIDRVSPGAPVILIGWSLGGIIAREFAKHAPGRVAKVVTLGSPFSGGPRANNAWRMYQLMAGHSVDNLPIGGVLHEKPPVPTIAFWSSRDGVVAARSACGLPAESDRQIEMDCTHMAYIARAKAITAIGAALA